MQPDSSAWIKISARMPRRLLDRLARLHPGENLSGLLRNLVEKEVIRQKVMKAHLKLYGRFKPEQFDEGLL